MPTTTAAPVESPTAAPITMTATPEWQPRTFHADPMVNAVLNVAAELNNSARAARGVKKAMKRRFTNDERLHLSERLQPKRTLGVRPKTKKTKKKPAAGG